MPVDEFGLEPGVDGGLDGAAGQRDGVHQRHPFDAPGQVAVRRVQA